MYNCHIPVICRVIVYIKNDLFFINPTINIFRSYIYEIEYEDNCMKLYHGSNQVIQVPDLDKSRKFLDFGSGFYLSLSIKQAENRAKSARLFFESGIPTVNVFDYNSTDSLKILRFANADIAWLDFVLANRKGESVAQYDIIIGPTANDKTILTIDQYLQGMFDHLENPKQLVIQLLQPENLETQYLFASQNALVHLIYSESYVL